MLEPIISKGGKRYKTVKINGEVFELPMWGNRFNWAAMPPGERIRCAVAICKKRDLGISAVPFPLYNVMDKWEKQKVAECLGKHLQKKEILNGVGFVLPLNQRGQTSWSSMTTKERTDYAVAYCRHHECGISRLHFSLYVRLTGEEKEGIRKSLDSGNKTKPDKTEQDKPEPDIPRFVGHMGGNSIPFGGFVKKQPEDVQKWLMGKIDDSFPSKHKLVLSKSRSVVLPLARQDGEYHFKEGYSGILYFFVMLNFSDAETVKSNVSGFITNIKKSKEPLDIKIAKLRLIADYLMKNWDNEIDSIVEGHSAAKRLYYKDDFTIDSEILPNFFESQS